jgi:hypothetical protein
MRLYNELNLMHVFDDRLFLGGFALPPLSTTGAVRKSGVKGWRLYFANWQGV